MRQRSEPLQVRANASTFPPGGTLDYAVPGWDQLLHAITGVMNVDTDHGTWIVPPHRALWLPDGTDYTAQMHGRVAVRALYLRSELQAMPHEVAVVNVPPLLRELILHVVKHQRPLNRDQPRDAHLIDVIVDQLQELPQAPLRLPQPSDPRARALAHLLETSPTASLDDLSGQVGASRRTLERLFLAETGMPIARWRRQLRVIQALRLLATGHTVTQAAHLVGYTTPSAFTAMFHTELGQTPAKYFNP